MMVKSILLSESTILDSTKSSINLIKSFSEVRTGIFNLLERLSILHKDVIIFYHNPNIIFSNAFFKRNDQIQQYQGEDVDIEIDLDKDYLPWDLVHSIGNQIAIDFKIWMNQNKSNNTNLSDHLLIGKEEELYIHPTATIFPEVTFDTTSGSIFIDKNVKISPHSLLIGPLYVGANSSIINAKVGDGCVIGLNCHIQCEVMHSLIGDNNRIYSDSTLNHTFTGDWITFGSFSGTSDLKLDYGKVTVSLGGGRLTQTAYIKWGAILSDFVRIPDKTVINPGSFIDMGGMMSINRYTGYYESFAVEDGTSKMLLDDFFNRINDRLIKTNQPPLSEEELIYIEDVYNNSQ